MLSRLMAPFMKGQYRRPNGWIGRYVGHRLFKENQLANDWTLDVLSPQPGETLLEIGYGPGYAIETLCRKDRFKKIYGVDFSEQMLRYALRRNRMAIEAGTVELLCEDAAQMPFSDSLFDKVFSIHTVYFWPDPLMVFRESYRVLKPGGQFILTAIPKERRIGEMEDGTAYPSDELIRLLGEAGFSDIQIVYDPEFRAKYTFKVLK